MKHSGLLLVGSAALALVSALLWNFGPPELALAPGTRLPVDLERGPGADAASASAVLESACSASAERVVLGGLSARSADDSSSAAATYGELFARHFGATWPERRAELLERGLDPERPLPADLQLPPLASVLGRLRQQFVEGDPAGLDGPQGLRTRVYAWSEPDLGTRLEDWDLLATRLGAHPDWEQYVDRQQLVGIALQWQSRLETLGSRLALQQSEGRSAQWAAGDWQATPLYHFAWLARAPSSEAASEPSGKPDSQVRFSVEHWCFSAVVDPGYAPGSLGDSLVSRRQALIELLAEREACWNALFEAVPAVVRAQPSGADQRQAYEPEEPASSGGTEALDDRDEELEGYSDEEPEGP